MSPSTVLCAKAEKLKLNKMVKIVRLAAFFITVLLAQTATAQERSGGIIGNTIEINKSISKKIDAAADAIDKSISNKNYTQKENPTSATLTQTVVWQENGRWTPTTRLGINLRLPNLEKRWQVRFSSYDQDKENRDLTQNKVNTRETKEEYSAGVAFLQELGALKFMFQPQLQLSDPLELKYLVRIKSEGQFFWFKMTPQLELYTDPNKGAGEFFKLNFGADLSKRWDMLIENAEEYSDRDNLFTTQHGLSFQYGINRKSSVALSGITRSSSRPKFHLDEITAAIPYSRQLLKKILKFSTSPFLSFNKSQSFGGRPGISFSLSMTF